MTLAIEPEFIPAAPNAAPNAARNPYAAGASNALGGQADDQQTSATLSFEEIVQRYGAMVYLRCYHVTRNAHDAEDAVQAVFLALSQHLRSGKPIHAVGPWLEQVAYRMSLNLLRTRKRRLKRETKVVEAQRDYVEQDPGESMDVDHVRIVVREELNELPTKYRLPLILHFFGNTPHHQIARELNISTNALSVRLHRAKKLLGERLSKRGVTLPAMGLALLVSEVIRSAVSEAALGAIQQNVAAASMHGAAGSVGAGSILACSTDTTLLAPIMMGARSMFRVKLAVMALAIGGTAVTGANTVTTWSAQLPELPIQWNPLDGLKNWLRSSTPSLLSEGESAAVERAVIAEAPVNDIPSHAAPALGGAVAKIAPGMAPVEVAAKPAAPHRPFEASSPTPRIPRIHHGPVPGVGGEYSVPSATVHHYVPPTPVPQSYDLAQRGAFRPSRSARPGEIVAAAPTTGWGSNFHAGAPITGPDFDFTGGAGGTVGSDLGPPSSSLQPPIAFEGGADGGLSISPEQQSYDWYPPVADASGLPSDHIAIRLAGVSGEGTLRLAEVTRHWDDLGLPEGHTFIGIWEADLDVAVDSMDWRIHYSDALLLDLGLDESHLKLWLRNVEGNWQRIDAGRDGELDYIWGGGQPGSHVAISTPEPSSMLAALGAGYLLLRRRRRH